ncbi:MAG: hypothetical protein AAF488_18590 [Planctomycetota bacterium]
MFVALILLGVNADSLWARFYHVPKARAELADRRHNHHRTSLRPHTLELIERWKSGDTALLRLVTDGDPVVWTRAAELLERASIQRDSSSREIQQYRDRLYRASRLAAVRITLLDSEHGPSAWRKLEPWRKSWRRAHPDPYSVPVRTFLMDTARTWDHSIEQTRYDPSVVRRRALDALLARWDPGSDDPVIQDLLRAVNEDESNRPRLTAHARGRTLELLGDVRFRDRWSFEDDITPGEPFGFVPVAERSTSSSHLDRATWRAENVDEATLVLLQLSEHPRMQRIGEEWRHGSATRRSRWAEVAQELPELPDFLEPVPFTYGDDYGLRLSTATYGNAVLLRWDVYGALPTDMRLTIHVPEGAYGRRLIEAGPRTEWLELSLGADSTSPTISITIGASVTTRRQDAPLRLFPRTIEEELAPNPSISFRTVRDRRLAGSAPQPVPLIQLPEGAVTVTFEPQPSGGG